MSDLGVTVIEPTNATTARTAGKASPVSSVSFVRPAVRMNEIMRDATKRVTQTRIIKAVR